MFLFRELLQSLENLERIIEGNVCEFREKLFQKAGFSALSGTGYQYGRKRKQERAKPFRYIPVYPFHATNMQSDCGLVNTLFHLMSSILCPGSSAIPARGLTFAGFDSRSGRVPVTLRGISARNTASGLLPPVLLTRKTRWSPAQDSLLRRLRSGRVFPFRRCRVSKRLRTPCRQAVLASRLQSSHGIRAGLSVLQLKQSIGKFLTCRYSQSRRL